MAAVNPDLVVRDENGEIYSVRYEAVNAMLLNEFLKEHRIVQEQNRKIQARIDHRTAKIRNGDSHRNGEGTGVSNPESERPD